MTTWFTRIAAGAFALAVLSVTSCKKDESQVVIAPSAAPALTASTTAPVLTTANANATAVTFTWTAANFGFQSATTYTLQFDKKGGNFASPVVFSGGTTAGNIALTTAQLSNVFTSLGYPVNSSAQIDARVIASVGAAVAAQTSSVATITATPIPVCVANANAWGLVGPAGDGWPGATATDRILNYDCYSQTYSLKTTLNAGEFKFRANKDWGTNLGGSGDLSKSVTLSLNGSNLSIATPGTYTITLAVSADATGKVTGGTVTVQ